MIRELGYLCHLDGSCDPCHSYVVDTAKEEGTPTVGMHRCVTFAALDRIHGKSEVVDEHERGTKVVNNIGMARVTRPVKVAKIAKLTNHKKSS